MANELTKDNLKLDKFYKFNNLETFGSSLIVETSKNLKIFKKSISELHTNLNNESNISKDLVKLRNKLEEINPKDLFETNFLYKLLGVNNIKKKLKSYSKKYNQISDEIDSISVSLKTGQVELNSNNTELLTLKDSILSQLDKFDENLNTGNDLYKELNEIVTNEQNTVVKDKLNSVSSILLLRIQDLSTMKQVLNQFVLNINIISTNNNLLNLNIDRTLNILVNTITVGMALEITLNKQKEILNAIEFSKEFATNLIVENSKKIKDNTNSLSTLYKNPLIEIEKIKESYTNLSTARRTAKNKKRKCRKIINQYKKVK